MSESTTLSCTLIHHLSHITRAFAPFCVLLWTTGSLSGCVGTPKASPILVRPPAPVVQQPQPKPKPDDVALLFPHHPGDHWVMTVTGEEESHQIDVTVKSGPVAAGVKTFY